MLSDGTEQKPLYVSLTEALRTDIRNGTYRPDERIPTEKELCQIHGVSRITVRKALEILSKEGLLMRKQGRGTYVASEKFYRDISRGSSFSSICTQTGQKPGAKVIKLIIENANEGDLANLELEAGDKVIVLERIRYADNVPVAFEISRFPETYSFLLDEDLNNTSLISILNDKYNIQFGHCAKVIELVYASYELSRYLNLKTHYPLISISSVSCDLEGKPAHRSLQYVVGDKFRFYIK